MVTWERTSKKWSKITLGLNTFRVGDTPSVLYLLDPEHDIDDPTESSWAGKFTRAWRLHKPNYYTDYAGDITWNYKNPCTTWENHDKVAATAQSTLLAERDEMYQQLLTKLDDLYRKQ